MAELLTYDPSNDPQAIQIAEERDAETLAVGQAMEDAQSNLLAGKYKSAQDLEKAYIELQQKLGSNDQQAEPTQEQEETSEPEAETDATLELFDSIDTEMSSGGELSAESLEKLSAMDSKDLVDAYFRYQSTLDSDDTPQGRVFVCFFLLYKVLRLLHFLYYLEFLKLDYPKKMILLPIYKHEF